MRLNLEATRNRLPWTTAVFFAVFAEWGLGGLDQVMKLRNGLLRLDANHVHQRRHDLLSASWQCSGSHDSNLEVLAWATQAELLGPRKLQLQSES